MSDDKNTFDAIVIGSGMSGGWAAKELCEKGLKSLVLERGRNVEHIKDYGAIGRYILKRARDIENHMYYYTTDTINYSLLHRAKYKLNYLYQQGQLCVGSYRETRRHLKILYNSLSMHLTALLRKLFDSPGSQ